MLTTLFLAHQIGLVPNPVHDKLSSRSDLCQSIAVNFAVAGQDGREQMAQATAEFLVQQNDDILSIAVIDSDGEYIAETSNHKTTWESISDAESLATHIQVPVSIGDSQQGAVQICFVPVVLGGIYGFLNLPIVKLTMFLAVVGFPIYWLYLSRAFRCLDPSKVIPERVKSILDTLSEGALVLDNKDQIIFANDAFTKATDHKLSDLQGRSASAMGWNEGGRGADSIDYPWSLSTSAGANIKGFQLTFQIGSGELRTFMVNSTPIRGGDGQIQGALATFDDVSEIEEKNSRLEKTVIMLSESRNQIKQQNEELKKLSMQDPLTGCLNRRAFFERCDAEWHGALRHGYSLGCIMVDVDRFKSINDQHGHAIGDKVLQGVSQVLRSATRKSDSVCRYGGEEFCILLPNTDINGAYDAAESIRRKIAEVVSAGMSITASLGVSAYELEAGSPQEMIDQADKALYAAKNGGRNCVVRWDKMPGDDVAGRSADTSRSDRTKGKHPVYISFSAVTALMSALEHREVTTAIHSRNVANLCVAMAKGLMPESDCFILEIAGLLHDIGKLGVPDSILLKPGALTEQEREIMATHDHMGVEIISASLGSVELTNIVKHSHNWYGGSAEDPDLPQGQDIPLRSRIVLIADAYDAMTSDRVYRKAMSQEDAFSELRRCAGKQFDPDLVERLIEVVQARDENRHADSLSGERAIALRIGLEIEKLACAAEAQDIALLSVIAGRLVDDANKIGLPEIAGVAHNLKQSTNSENDMMNLLGYTNELIELCRVHQDSCLSG